MEQVNPFALVKASDYTDEQINSLWVELGTTAIDQIIEPRSQVSKLILGGKGTGKTHLLRYYSYSAVRLRHPTQSGISILGKQKFLAVFIRANGLDAFRFERGGENPLKWQQAFAMFLELRLVEAVVEALQDIRLSSPNDTFNDQAFLSEIKNVLADSTVTFSSIIDLRDWVALEKKRIDDQVNNSAFSGKLDLRIPFSIGSLALNMSRCIGLWHPSLVNLPLIYLIDEIENFSSSQQQVVNTMIRYGEGRATFRIGGRLYAMKTFATLSNGEENREGSEYKAIFLDDILRGFQGYPEFARKFVYKRLASVGLISIKKQTTVEQFDPRSFFDEIDPRGCYSSYLRTLDNYESEPIFLKTFRNAFDAGNKKGVNADTNSGEICSILTDGLPLLIQKLNILLFCKKCRSKMSFKTVAAKLREDSIEFLSGEKEKRNYYATAYGHWASDLFAQLCRELKRGRGMPYASFDSFVQMSSGNPRNLLIVLGRTYAITAFKGLNFIDASKVPVEVQTEACLEAARFFYDADTNFGSQSEEARNAVTRLATLLRTARYALNVPEVSPLAVSFSDADLSEEAERTLRSALHFSFLYEINDGRPDRNSQKLNKKIQLNPLLSPKWGLPIGRRGDLSLSKALLNSIFEPNKVDEFDALLKVLQIRWNNPFSKESKEASQEELF